MKTLKFRTNDVEDRSGIDDDAEYRCTDQNCGKVSIGSHLLPVVYRPLKDDEPLRCNVRRCPYCRGSVVRIDPVNAGICCR